MVRAVVGVVCGLVAGAAFNMAVIVLSWAIYPPPAGVISVYPTATDVVVPLSRRDFSTPIHGHGRLAWYVPTTQPPSMPIVLKFEPTAAVAAPVVDVNTSP